ADAIQTVANLTGGAFSLGFMGFLTAFFFFFIATGWAKFLAFTDKLIPAKHRDEAHRLIGEFDRVISGFVRGRLIIALIQAVIFAILYTLIGTPAALLFGIVIGLLSIVPYLAIIGIPATIIAMWLDPAGPTWQNSWWWTLIAPIIVYNVGQAVDDYFLTPAIQGKATDMDTPTILFSSIAGGALLGVFGLLIAIPIAACVKILLREVFWPRFSAWVEGREKDFLPIDRE
ncbi:MAG: AI-2E family transporter, partial [Planctomycetota bacterium]